MTAPEHAHPGAARASSLTAGSLTGPSALTILRLSRGCRFSPSTRPRKPCLVRPRLAARATCDAAESTGIVLPSVGRAKGARVVALFGGLWKADLDPEAAVWSWPSVDLGVVGSGDGFDDREPEPVSVVAVGAGGLESLKRLE